MHATAHTVKRSRSLSRSLHGSVADPDWLSTPIGTASCKSSTVSPYRRPAYLRTAHNTASTQGQVPGQQDPRRAKRGTGYASVYSQYHVSSWMHSCKYSLLQAYIESAQQPHTKHGAIMLRRSSPTCAKLAGRALAEPRVHPAGSAAHTERRVRAKVVVALPSRFWHFCRLPAVWGAVPGRRRLCLVPRRQVPRRTHQELERHTHAVPEHARTL